MLLCVIVSGIIGKSLVLSNIIVVPTYDKSILVDGRLFYGRGKFYLHFTFYIPKHKYVLMDDSTKQNTCRGYLTLLPDYVLYIFHADFVRWYTSNFITAKITNSTPTRVENPCRKV